MKKKNIVALLFLLLVVGKLNILRKSLLTPSEGFDAPAKELFQKLQSNGLLSSERTKDSEINIPEEDYVLARKAQNIGGLDLEDKQKLLDSLYSKSHGKRLQKQIKLWNLGQNMAAVRDDRPQTDTDKTDDKGWNVIDLTTGRNLPSEAILAAKFIYVGGEQLRAGFHDWFTSHSPDNHLMKFSTEFIMAQPKTVHIQIVGGLDKEKLKNDLKSYHPLIQPRLPEIHRQGDSAIAYEITLSLPKGKNPVEFQLSNVKSEVNEIDGVAIYLGESKDDSNKMCPKGNVCFFWDSKRLHNNTGTKIKEDKSYTIYTRDGIALTEEIPSDKEQNKTDVMVSANIGKPTQFTLKNGLLSLIGQNKHDRYALSGLVNVKAEHNDTTIHLTLHSKMQEIAQRLLSSDKSVKLEQNIASLVLLNPANGEILAAASNPVPPINVHPWDKAAFSQVHPDKDPMQVGSWQGVSGFNQPGSTFKVLTTLAGFAAVNEGDSNLEQMMKGVTTDKLKTITGLDPNSSSFTILAEYTDDGNSKVIHNHGNTMISAYANPILGLKEALSHSLNSWFIQLIFNMDSKYLINNKNPDGTKTHLGIAAEQQGFIGYYPLAPESLKLSRYPAKGLARGDVLNAFGGRLGSYSTKITMGSLLQNSIGQDVTTSPLQIARLAATVATGENTQPRLIYKWDNKQLDDYPATKKLDIKDEQLALLRQSMKEVVKSGTASGAFSKELKNHVYGKTGSAQVDDCFEKYIDQKGKLKCHIKSDNTAWFMGWYENNNHKPTLAFACQVTRTHGGEGGSICAPLVKNVLQALEKANLLEVPNAK